VKLLILAMVCASPALAQDKVVATVDTSRPSGQDTLQEVNALRAKRGLPPYVYDEQLALGAVACAKFRAAKLMAGHTQNDFAFLPAGAHASGAGCAAATPGWGWLSCYTYSSYRYAGAAWSMGRDGKRYTELFVR
jgi:hypothetical protein